MALTLKRLPGQELTLTLTGGGTSTAWETMRVETSYGFATATAATAEFIQKVLTKRDSRGSMVGFLGTEGVPPAEGDELTVVSVMVGEDEVTDADIDNAVVYGKIRVTRVYREFQGDPAKYGFDWEGGFVD